MSVLYVMYLRSDDQAADLHENLREQDRLSLVEEHLPDDAALVHRCRKHPFTPVSICLSRACLGKVVISGIRGAEKAFAAPISAESTATCKKNASPFQHFPMSVPSLSKHIGGKKGRFYTPLAQDPRRSRAAARCPARSRRR